MDFNFFTFSQQFSTYSSQNNQSLDPVWLINVLIYLQSYIFLSIFQVHFQSKLQCTRRSWISTFLVFLSSSLHILLKIISHLTRFGFINVLIHRQSDIILSTSLFFRAHYCRDFRPIRLAGCAPFAVISIYYVWFKGYSSPGSCTLILYFSQSKNNMKCRQRQDTSRAAYSRMAADGCWRTGSVERF